MSAVSSAKVEQVGDLCDGLGAGPDVAHGQRSGLVDLLGSALDSRGQDGCRVAVLDAPGEPGRQGGPVAVPGGRPGPAPRRLEDGRRAPPLAFCPAAGGHRDRPARARARWCRPGGCWDWRNGMTTRRRPRPPASWVRFLWSPLPWPLIPPDVPDNALEWSAELGPGALAFTGRWRPSVADVSDNSQLSSSESLVRRPDQCSGRVEAGSVAGGGGKE